eukprot:1999575-Rhodomonas_salina.1
MSRQTSDDGWEAVPKSFFTCLGMNWDQCCAPAKISGMSSDGHTQEAQRGTDRQTDRQTDPDTHTQTRDRDRDRDRDGQRLRQRQTDTDAHTDTVLGGGHIYTHAGTDRQTHTDTHR